MKKFGTPIGTAPIGTSDSVGLAGSGMPLARRNGVETGLATGAVAGEPNGAPLVAGALLVWPVVRCAFWAPIVGAGTGPAASVVGAVAPDVPGSGELLPPVGAAEAPRLMLTTGELSAGSWSWSRGVPSGSGSWILIPFNRVKVTSFACADAGTTAPITPALNATVNVDVSNLRLIANNCTPPMHAPQAATAAGSLASSPGDTSVQPTVSTGRMQRDVRTVGRAGQTVGFRATIMTDPQTTDGVRERFAARGEETLGRLAQDLLENPLVNGALNRALGVRDKAAQAQEVAMGALNIPSASDLERLTRRLRSVSQRLEGIEDGLDRVEQSTKRRPDAGADLAPRLAAIEDRLAALSQQVEDLSESPASPVRERRADKAAPSKPAAARKPRAAASKPRKTSASRSTPKT
jgi:hypothetical protein